MRTGSIRNYPVGEFEDNNPMLFIAVPERLRNNHQLTDNLYQNSHSLVTHYDIYATLIDIAKVAPMSNFDDWQEFNFDRLQNNRRGQSLLRPFGINEY